MENTVIILGQDHTNTLGLCQILGADGYRVVPTLVGERKGLVNSSKYVEGYIGAESYDSAISLIRNAFMGGVILPSCDAAAQAVERHSKQLGPRFRHQHATCFTLAEAMEKDLQTQLARECGFLVPESRSLGAKEDFLAIDFEGPYILKPQVSMIGGKADITLCATRQQISQALPILLQHQPHVLCQQYINHDFEISILGCGFRDGRVFVPLVEFKYELFPPKKGLESKAVIKPLLIPKIADAISSLVHRIGYVGLFSVEMMHNPADGQYWFTEINLRNDGAQAFIRKSGVDLPNLHVEDLLDHVQDLPHIQENLERTYIWEMHHTRLLASRGIGLGTWMRDLRHCQGFLTYYKSDRKPFFRQYWCLASKALRRKQVAKYSDGLYGNVLTDNQ